MITVQEYAEQNNQTVGRIMELINNGSIYGEEKEGVWHIDPLKPNMKLPFIVEFLNLLSFAVLLGGILMVVSSWPDDPGYSYRAAAYFQPIAWATAGIFQFALFAAFAKTITYLSKIEFNTRKF